MTADNHVNVVIATPGSHLMGSYVKSLLKTLEVFSQNNISSIYANAYASHVGDAREITLSGTPHNSLTERRPFEGNISYDTILWIDSDIAWEPNDALRLIRSDKDIVTGAYLLADGRTPIYPKVLENGYTYQDILNKTELEEISGCGFGFMAVKKGVFENLTRPWFQSANIDKEIDGTNYNFNIMGEDLSWCYRARNAGFKIWFDPMVRVTHHKTLQLTWEGVRS